MVTAELAVGLLSATVVLGMMIYAIGVGIAHVKTQESARAGARAAARGDSTSEVVSHARRSLPGARVDVSRSGGSSQQVKVAVSVTVRPIFALPRLKVSSSSVAQVEPR